MKSEKVYYEGPMRSQFRKRADYDKAVAEWNEKQEKEDGKYRIAKMRRQSQAFMAQSKALSE